MSICAPLTTRCGERLVGRKKEASVDFFAHNCAALSSETSPLCHVLERVAFYLHIKRVSVHVFSF